MLNNINSRKLQLQVAAVAGLAAVVIAHGFAHSAAPGYAIKSSAETVCGTQTWFDLTPRRIKLTCGATFPFLPISPADVNGDGIIEQFQGPSTNPGILIVTSGSAGPYNQRPTPIRGVAVPNPILVSRLSIVDGELTVGTGAVIDLPESFGQSLVTYLPSPGYPTPTDNSAYQMLVRNIGWFDCDADGDLDLVLLIESQRKRYWHDGNGDNWGDWEGLNNQAFWLENIGHERNPNAADLDGNGSVDGGDLSLLLLNFT